MQRVPELVQVLKDHERALSTLTTELREQRVGLVSMRASELEAHREHAEKAAQRCRDLDTERDSLCRAIASELGVEPVALTASAIASHATAVGETLVRQAKRTRDAAEKLEVELRVGAELLAWSAQAHEGLITMLAEDRADGPCLIDACG